MAQKVFILERGKIEIDNSNLKCYLGKGGNVQLSEDLFKKYKVDLPKKLKDYFYLDQERYLIIHPIPEKKISIIDNKGDKYKATVYFLDDIINIVQGLNISNPHYLSGDSYIKINKEIDYIIFLLGTQFKEIKDIGNEDIDFTSLSEDYKSEMNSSVLLKDINKNISHYSNIDKIGEEEYIITNQRNYQYFVLNKFCENENRREVEDIIYGIFGNYACGKSTFLMHFNYTCEFPSIYLNLKVLKNAFKTTGFRDIINNELMLLFKKLKKSFDEYKSFIMQFLPYEKQDLKLLILSIVDKLKNQKIIFILDQYKEELFPDINFISELKSKLFENDSKFKVIITSSIDDGDIRDTYYDLIFNKINLKDEKTREENKKNKYIPYNFTAKLIDDIQIKNVIKYKNNNNNRNDKNKDNITNQDNIGKENENNIKFEKLLKLFNYLPLYYNLCVQFKDNLDNFKKETKERIEKKIIKFNEKMKVDLINLDEIRKMIDNEVSELRLKSFFKYIPFKYFYIERKNGKLFLRTHFPLIKDILINIIMKQTVNLFDGEIKYDGNVIGSLLELNLIINVKDKTIPLDIDSYCKVDEINEFRELIENDTKEFNDKNIFITQIRQNGAHFDLAYFQGKNTNCKKLVYIQVKKSLSKNKVNREQTKEIFREKSQNFLQLFKIKPDEFNLVYITLVNEKIKESVNIHGIYKKDKNKKISDLGNETNSIVYSINLLETFCNENSIQLFYYEPKTHQFYIKEKNEFKQTKLDLLKENNSELYVGFKTDYLMEQLENSINESENINKQYKIFLNKKTKKKPEKFTYKVGDFDFNILFDFTKDYFVNTYIIKYVDLRKVHLDMVIANQSSKQAIVCIKLKNQKEYIIDSFIYKKCNFKIENNIIKKYNNIQSDRDNDFIIIIGFDSILDNLKDLL